MERFRRKIKFDTIKALLARSGNECAHPDCSHPLFNDDNLFIAQLCHIEALSPKGPRYNPNTNIEQVNSYPNLLFMCYRHHKETDNTHLYPVETLIKIKENHESRFMGSNFSVSNEVIKDLLTEINDYWERIEYINNNEHVAVDFKVDISTNADELELTKSIRTRVAFFNDIIDNLSRDLKSDNFEMLCLAVPNTMTRINVLIDQLEIKILEMKLISEPSRVDLKKELDRLREEFKYTAKHTGLAD